MKDSMRTVPWHLSGPEQIGELKLIDTRKYGRNMIKFYRNERNAGITLA